MPSSLSKKPKPEPAKSTSSKKASTLWGAKPEENLTRDALTKPNATVIGREQVEENQLHQLSIALKQKLLKEMRDDRNAGRTNQ